MFGIIRNRIEETAKMSMQRHDIEFDLMNSPKHRKSNSISKPIFRHNSYNIHVKNSDYLYEDNQLAIFITGQFHNTNELKKALGLRGNSIPISVLIRTAYNKWGAKFVHYLIGEFVIIIWSEEKKVLQVFRDPLGIAPIYYSYIDSTFYFSTELRRLSIIKKLTPIDIEYVKLALSKTIPQSYDRTWFSSVKRVPPGSQLSMVNNQLSVNKYYLLPTDIREIKLDQALEGFRSKLSAAVIRHVRNVNRISTHMSGGLDSSGITAVAWHYAQTNKIPFVAYACGLDDEQIKNHYQVKDDRESQRALASFMNLPLHRTLSYSEIVNLEDYTRDYQMPHTTELKTYLEASLSEIKAEQGGVLLSGFGGDECVTYNQYPHFIVAAARGGKWKSLLNSLRAYGWIKSVLILLRSFNLFNDLFHKIKNPKYKRDKHLKIRPLKKLIDTNFLKGPRFDLTEDIRAHLNSPHIAHRIEQEKEYAAYYDVELCYPLLDLELVEFFLSLPVGFKIYKQKGREFYREAIKKWLNYRPFLEASKSRNATVPIQDLRELKYIDEQLISYEGIYNSLPLELKNIVNKMPIPTDPYNRLHRFYHRKYLLLAEVSSLLNSHSQDS